MLTITARQPHFSAAEALSAIPVKNPVVHESREGNCALLSYPQFAGPLARILAALYLKRRAVQSNKLELDSRETHVWDAINGNRTIARLTADFSEKFKTMPKEAETFVALFLEKLHQRRLITMR